MRGDGQGGLAGAGQAGRCAECCGPFPGDGGCTNSFTECCDGECRFTNTDEEHCGGCAYAGGGGSACSSGISACTPGTQCRDGVCLYSSPCPNSPDQAYACELPSSGQISPACLQDCTTRYCDATGCNSLFYYSCIGACPDLTTPQCLDKASNYQGCDLTCTPVVGCFGDGTVCSTNTDCCSGACRSPCKANVFGTDCNEPPICVKP
jgi:hypothetical protein